MKIVPYQSVGDVRFGMKPEEVANVLGTPVAVTTNFLGETKCVYETCVVEFDDRGAAGITPDASREVVILGHSIVNNEEGWNTLLRISKERFRCHDTIVLLDIGVAISDNTREPFPLTAFVRGGMDSLLSEFERISDDSESEKAPR